MESLHFLLALPGFMIGMLMFTRVGYLLINFLGLEPGVTKAQEQDADRRKKYFYGATVFLCSWLLVFGGVSVYLWLARLDSPGWFWFFTGIAATPTVTIPSVLHYWKQSKDQGQIN